MASNFVADLYSDLNNTFHRSSAPSQAQTLDTILRAGKPVVLDYSQWNLVSNFFILFFTLFVSRAFISFAFLFFCLLWPSNRSWDVDQLRAIMSNVPACTDALFDSRTWKPWVFATRRTGGARTITALVLWKLAALAFVALTLLSPIFVTLVPVVPGILGNKKDCVGWTYADFKKLGSQSVLFPLFADITRDSLRTADANYDNTATTAKGIGLNVDETALFSNKCPDYVDNSLCAENGLFVGTNFWLNPSEAYVGDADDIQVSFATTCFKAAENITQFSAADRAQLFGDDNPGDGGVYGLDYGSYLGRNFTDVVSASERQSSSYYWMSTSYVRAPKNPLVGLPKETFGDQDSPLSQLAWQPHPSIKKYEGDISILVFHGAGPLGAQTKDPIFETLDKPSSVRIPIFDDKLYQAKNLAVPIICNTTYTVCKGNNGQESNGCQRLGGFGAFYDYSIAYTGSSQMKGWLQTMALNSVQPLISVIAGFPDSIKAANTLFQTVQTASSSLSGRSEIIRLLLAARTWMSLSARKAAQGEDLLKSKSGKLPEGLGFYTTPDQRTMCSYTLLDAPGKFIVSRSMLETIAGVFIGVLALLFGLPLLERPLWKHVGPFAVRWRSYGFAQLHRMLSEKTNGVYWVGAINSYPSAPRGTVVGSLRFVEVTAGEDGNRLSVVVGADSATVASEGLVEKKPRPTSRWSEDEGEQARPHIETAPSGTVEQTGSTGVSYYTVTMEMTGKGAPVDKEHLPGRKEMSRRGEGSQVMIFISFRLYCFSSVECIYFD